MFVARYSYNPQYDAVRRWTAYMEPKAATREGLAEFLIELGIVKLPARLNNAYWDGDVDAAIEYVLETADIRYHETAGLWMLVHNPRGLSCWPLSASSIEEAIEEARSAPIKTLPVEIALVRALYRENSTVAPPAEGSDPLLVRV